MKRLFIMLPFLLLFLAACAPAQERSLSPSPTLMVSEQAEVQSEPTLIEEIQPTATKKPKDHREYCACHYDGNLL